MSTAAASNARREFWPWLGHNAWRGLIVVDFSLVVQVVTSGVNAALSIVLAVVNLAALVLMIATGHRHQHNLCVRCMNEMPLDPQAEVKHKDRWLRLAHLPEKFPRHDKWKLITFGALFLVIYAVLIIWGPSWLKTAIIALVIGIWAPLNAYSYHWHRQLEAWCPYCDHRRRGKDTFDPEPAPDPRIKATR